MIKKEKVAVELCNILSKAFHVMILCDPLGHYLFTKFKTKHNTWLNHLADSVGYFYQVCQ